MNVAVNGDTVRESNETFALNLSAATNAVTSKARGVGVIQNNDFVADLSVTQNASAASVAGGSEVVFTLTVKNSGLGSATDVMLSNELSNGATVTVAVTGGAATFSFGVGRLIHVGPYPPSCRT